MPRLTFYLLGSPRIQVDEEPVALRRRKALALLAYLAVTRRTHSRDALATLLWPGYGQSEARGHLRRALNSLRRALDHRWIETDYNSVGLSAAADIWTDVDHLHSAITSCRSHGHTTDEICPLCLPILDQAVALHQDGFMAGFTLPDAPDFDDRQYYQSELLRNECMAALDKLSRAYAVRGEYDLAIARALQRLSLDALHEPTHRLLMQLYAAADQQPAALRQYELCVKTLREEASAEPSAETTALKEQIRSGSFQWSIDHVQLLDSPLRHSPSPAQSSHFVHQQRVHNLPAQTTPFVGRQAELTALTQLFADPIQRLITILGPGGIGKTRLALEMASLLVDKMEDGVFFVPLAQLGDGEHIVPAIAEAIDFHFRGDGRPVKQQLFDYLGSKQLLLVLDNFEHLLPSVHLLQELLQASPRLRLLATSRERLQLMDEVLFTLGSMDFPTWEVPPDAQDYSAVQLFVQTARRIRPGRAISTDDMQYIVRICRLVGGMPLGIILAASWVGVLSLDQIAAELTQSLDLLETQLRDLPERQRSMGAVLRYSWRQLTSVERETFMRLSVLRGGFSRDAAQMIAGASLPILARLIDKSFVQRMGDDRYDIHELLRQYGEQQLIDCGAQRAAEEAHSAYYLDFLHRCEAELAGPAQLSAIAALEVDFENVRAAWHEAVQARRYALVERALEGLFRWLWMVRNRQHEGRAWLRMAREQWAPAPGEGPHPVLGKILARVLDVQANWFAHPEQAQKRVAQALSIAEANNDRAEVAFCHWMLGVAHMGDPQHDYHGALAHFEQSMQYYRASDDTFRIAQLLQDMGHAHHQLWHLDRASDCLQACLDLRDGMGDKIGQGYCLSHLGWNAWQSGNAKEAASYWQQALRIRMEVDDRQGTADCMFELSLLALTEGDWGRGKELAQDVLKISRAIGSTLHERYAVRELEIANCMATSAQPDLPSDRVISGRIPAPLISLFYVVFGFDEISSQYPRELLPRLAEGHC